MRGVFFYPLLPSTVLCAALCVGCAATPSSNAPSTFPAQASVVLPGTLQVRVNLAGCGCDLHAIDTALLSLPNVATLKWSPDLSFVTLGIFNPGPSDEQIAGALEPLDVNLFQGVRRP